MDRDYREVWDKIKRNSNDIREQVDSGWGGLSQYWVRLCYNGAGDIAKMWKIHYQDLNNSINNQETRDKFTVLVSNVENMKQYHFFPRYYGSWTKAEERQHSRTRLKLHMEVGYLSTKYCLQLFVKYVPQSFM